MSQAGLGDERSALARESSAGSSHVDFKTTPDGWLVRCPRWRGWAAVRDGRCAGCETDVSDRITAEAL